MTAIFSMRNAARYPTQVTVGLVCVLLVLIVALAWYLGARNLRISVQESTEASNRTLTRVFVNENWGAVQPLLPPPGSGAQAASSNPHIAALDQIVRRFSSYTDVLKVKIYDLSGMTVYSSERKQIGEDKARNVGFQTAARGGVASELIYRGKFGGFDVEVYDRNLVSTYVPVRVGDRVEAVLEIYSDRTASIEFINRELRSFVLWMAPLVLGALVLLSAVAWGLQRAQQALARERALAQEESLRERGGPMGSGLGPAKWMDRLPKAFDGLDVLLDRARGAAAVSEPAAALGAPAAVSRPDSPPWHDLMTRVSQIERWASVRRDLAQAGRAGKPVTAELLDLDAVVRGVMSTLIPLAQAQGKQLLVHCHPVTLGSGRTDRLLLPRLLTHLVAASLDAPASPGRPARVQVKLSRQGASLHVDVVDDCVGLQQEQIDGWLRDWESGQVPMADDEMGLVGWRLLIARDTAQRLGGRFDARGTQDLGNRWLVDLPLEAANTEAVVSP